MHLRLSALALFALTFATTLCAAPQDDQYVPGPDSAPQAGVPQGKIIPMEPWKSKIYEGTLRDWWLYVPAQYDGSKPACVMIFCDGGKGNDKDPKFGGPQSAVHVFNNLIHKKEMPVTIGIFISPGSFPTELQGGKPRSNRSFEYDTPDGTYARFRWRKSCPRSRRPTSSPTVRRIARRAATAAAGSAPSPWHGSGLTSSARW
jgi:hypothetical protein